jgi:hypothetical protein
LIEDVGIERVKECKRRLEFNHPLSITLSHGVERGCFNCKLKIAN